MDHHMKGYLFSGISKCFLTIFTDTSAKVSLQTLALFFQAIRYLKHKTAFLNMQNHTSTPTYHPHLFQHTHTLEEINNKYCYYKNTDSKRTAHLKV